MKKYSHTVNISTNSNIVIGHTENDWASLRNNSIISFEKDSHFYTIGRIEKINPIYDFTYQNNLLYINSDCVDKLLHNDVIKISYKEYELLTIYSIDEGIGYNINDIIYPSDGIVSKDIITNQTLSTQLKVTKIDANGKILDVDIINKGTYIEPPQSNYFSGGHGSKAKINFKYEIIANRKMIERQIEEISFNGNQTIIKLNYNLPNISNGKFSFSKYVCYLTSNYIGPTLKNGEYSINRDFTPNLGLPLIQKNSNKTEDFFNHILLELDKKISNLELEIQKLKTK